MPFLPIPLCLFFHLSVWSNVIFLMKDIFYVYIVQQSYHQAHVAIAHFDMWAVELKTESYI